MTIKLKGSRAHKEKFYAKYATNHTRPRGGDVTLGTLKSMAVIWKKTFGRFLPEHKQARIVDLGCDYGGIVWWLNQAGFSNVLVATSHAEESLKPDAIASDAYQAARAIVGMEKDE
ncbi:MAG: hypothetical protein V1823_03840 [Chloroflexota bacterium]